MPDAPEPSTSSLQSLFRDALAGKRPISEPLDALLESTGSRAVGLWRMEPLDLVQVGFRAHRGMSVDVRVAFEQATLRVPLEQTGLGIVQAAVSRSPALATADPDSGQLGASATWLQRFEARQSLAVPIEDERGVRGVLAISTARPLVPDGEEWRLLLELAGMLATWL